MAKRKAKKTGTRKAGAKRRASPRPKARSGAARKRAAAKPAAPAVRIGMITLTELASTDPMATREWCASVLGWKFGESVPTPQGPYHMWRFANDTGGGIRVNTQTETPGSTPYVEVRNIRATYEQALAAGAREMVPPMALPGGMGWIAVVAAPGGPAIGFWAPS
jgi:predicted enzyme related to lactoylglutathione lyase